MIHLHFQKMVNLFDSLIGGGEHEEDAIFTSLVDQQDDTGMFLILLLPWRVPLHNRNEF